MTLCVIPARGGSKRIPRKNIRSFCGKPMIVWSIEAAQRSGCFERIIVSTDDIEIAEVAQEAGVEAPFVRPDNLSDDHATTGTVVVHAINWLVEQEGYRCDYICCLYATAPFVSAESLRVGQQSLLASGADYLFPVTSYAFPIQRALRVTDDNRVDMFQPEHFFTRSQDLEEAYHDAGQFYWGRREAWLAEKPIFNSVAVPLILPRYRVQDIDTLEDWQRAEWLFRALQEADE